MSVKELNMKIFMNMDLKELNIKIRPAFQLYCNLHYSKNVLVTQLLLKYVTDNIHGKLPDLRNWEVGNWKIK